MRSARSNRSRGCETCLTRKVKCDETRPQCDRCQSAGVECAGYVRPIKFVDERRRVIAALDRASAQESRWNVSSQGLLVIRSAAPTLTRMDRQWSRPGQIQEMNLSAFQDDIYISFLMRRLFQLPGQRQALGHWMGAVSGEGIADSALSLCVRSIATSFYGRVHRQPAITARAAQLYGSALGRFSQLLQDPQKCWSFEALACASALELYELVTYTVAFGWVQHAGGIGKLLEARGPWRHKERSHRKVFLENRTNVVLNAILNRKRTFLEQRTWKEVPWEDDPRSKTKLDYLIDILCDYPGLLEDADNVRLRGAPTWTDVLHRCHETLAQLSEWHRGWLSEFATCRYKVGTDRSSYVSLEAGGPIFPSIFYFTDIWRGYEFCVHNALRILLLRLHSQIGEYVNISSSPGHPGATTEIEQGASAEELAIEICRSVDYFLNKHGQMGALLLMLPAQIALLPLDRGLAVAVWLMNVLKKIGESDGLEIGRQILEGRCTDLAPPMTSRPSFN